MSDKTPIRRIAVGADHGGFDLKETIKAHLQQRGFAVEDCGTCGKESVDYPVFARAVAELVAAGKADRGIIVDGAGIGSAMVANKLPGVRAALCYDVSSARNSREHNDANVLTLGAGLIGTNLALQIVDVWLESECTAERHLRRVAMIEEPHEAASASSTATDEQRGGVEENLNDLSEQDLEQIVRRIAELTGSMPVAGDSMADVCTNIACTFCKICAETNPELVRQFVDLGADRIVHMPGTGPLPEDLAKYIDHTLLKPDATAQQILDLCAEAQEYGFASVCVNPNWVVLAAKCLKGTPVKVCSVVGFPLGAHVPEIKAMEARRAIREGAREIDMVINVGALKGGDDELVYRDIRAVTDACLEGRSICKVIIEAALLTDEEKTRACLLSKRARANFVKTSTGFGPGGATADDVALMAKAVRGARIGVKASGGIRNYKDAETMIQAGATRLGVSAGVRIIEESKGMTVSEGDTVQKY
ncbi:MAG: deoxyribose-phosphate aldolase [Phycisphaerae bacterium]|nr:deoxyribose-phosphate aldolase [Phycisphaerae bacterium]